MDQIEVAPPLPKFGIGQALVLLGRRGDRLAQQFQVLGEDGQLALHGPLEFAVDADDVAEVEALGQGEVLVAHLALADHHLNGAGPIADLQPMNLARGPPQHDSPRRANLGPMRFGRMIRLGLSQFSSQRKWDCPLGPLASDGDFALSAADFANALMIVETGTPGVDAHFAYFAQFLASCGFETGFAGSGLLRDRFVHA